MGRFCCGGYHKCPNQNASLLYVSRQLYQDVKSLMPRVTLELCGPQCVQNFLSVDHSPPYRFLQRMQWADINVRTIDFALGRVATSRLVQAKNMAKYWRRQWLQMLGDRVLCTIQVVEEMDSEYTLRGTITVLSSLAGRMNRDQRLMLAIASWGVGEQLRDEPVWRQAPW